MPHDRKPFFPEKKEGEGKEGEGKGAEDAEYAPLRPGGHGCEWTVEEEALLLQVNFFPPRVCFLTVLLGF
jgi:hypothetical protein